MKNNMEYPIISIVTPSYNQGQFISDTIESVIHQEGDFYIDYIIMDGASTDNSVEVIKKYAALVEACPVVYEKDGVQFHKYGNCKGVAYRWVSEKDRGQSHAINKGYRIAVGDIFNWLNSDDKYLENIFSIIKNYLIDMEHLIVFGGCIAYDNKGKKLWEHNPSEVGVYNLLYRHEGVPQPSVFWRKVITDDRVSLVDENLKYTMDTDLWFHFFRKKIKWYRIDKNLSVQIYHPNSKSCEGDEMFEKFKPENDKIKKSFRRSLGIDHYYYSFLRFLENRSSILFRILKKIRYY